MSCILIESFWVLDKDEVTSVVTINIIQPNKRCIVLKCRQHIQLHRQTWRDCKKYKHNRVGVMGLREERVRKTLGNSCVCIPGRTWRHPNLDIFRLKRKNFLFIVVVESWLSQFWCTIKGYIKMVDCIKKKNEVLFLFKLLSMRINKITIEDLAYIYCLQSPQCSAVPAPTFSLLNGINGEIRPLKTIDYWLQD